MPTMKAVVISGAPQGQVEHAKVAVPRHGPDELLVRVKAVGVGIHDSYFLPAGITPPFPIGIEAAGAVEEVGGALAGRYRRGDRIAFVSTDQLKGGTWAEYAAVRADALIVPIPAGMDYVHAAAMPVAASTTLRALHALGPMPAGGSLFVAGASGAIGTIALQLAPARGWQVAGSASPRNHDYLASLGRAWRWTTRTRAGPRRSAPGGHGVDAALAVQPATTEACIEVAKDGGTVVSISGDHAVPARGVRVTGPAYTADVRAELQTAGPGRRGRTAPGDRARLPFR